MTTLLRMAKAFYDRCPTEFVVLLNGAAYHSTTTKPWDALTPGEIATVCAGIKAALQECRHPGEAHIAPARGRTTAESTFEAVIDAILAEQGDKG